MRLARDKRWPATSGRGRNKEETDAGTARARRSRATAEIQERHEKGGLPAGWVRTTLGDSCDIFAGFGFPERLQGKVQGDLAFFKVGDISEAWKRRDVFLSKANHYISQAEAAAIRAKPLPRGTTVFAKIGAAIALNRRAILRESSLVDNNVMGLHPTTDVLDSKYLFHFVCTLRFGEFSRATTVPSVRKSDIEGIPIPLPPLPEQRRIVAEVERLLSEAEKQERVAEEGLRRAERLRQAVLRDAFAGKLVPQNPTEEPESGLPEGIRQKTKGGPRPPGAGRSR